MCFALGRRQHLNIKHLMCLPSSLNTRRSHWHRIIISKVACLPARQLGIHRFTGNPVTDTTTTTTTTDDDDFGRLTSSAFQFSSVLFSVFLERSTEAVVHRSAGAQLPHFGAFQSFEFDTEHPKAIDQPPAYLIDDNVNLNNSQCKQFVAQLKIIKKKNIFK